MKPATAASALRVQAILGDEFAVLEFEETTRTAADAAAAIGCSVAQIAKSLVFRSAGGKPVLEAIGQRIFIMSDQPDAANLVKISGNFLIATVIESLGEAMALVGKAGVDRHAYLDLLTSTLFSAPVYRTYGVPIVERKFEPAGFDKVVAVNLASIMQISMRFHDALAAANGSVIVVSSVGAIGCT